MKRKVITEKEFDFEQGGSKTIITGNHIYCS